LILHWQIQINFAFALAGILPEAEPSLTAERIREIDYEHCPRASYPASEMDPFPNGRW